MSLSAALRSVGLGKLKIVEGGIYRLKDGLIRFPESDKADNRTKHEFRTVLVLSNQKMIDSYECACVIVAPMSHHTHLRSLADIVVEKNETNNLSQDGRVMFGYLQPVRKSDLEKQIGLLTEEQWQQVMEQIIFCFDH